MGRKTLILAGGFGKRLRPFTSEMPKPMLAVAGRPLIEWQMKWLEKNGIKDLVICVGYLKEKIMEHVGNGSRFGVNVTYSVEEKALGTGGAIMNARRVLSSDLMQEGGEGFFVINGDILTTIDPSKLVMGGETHGIAAVQMRNPFGVISTGDEKEISYVTEFLQKPVMDNVWINAGIYFFRKEIFEYLPEVGDFEAPVLPLLVRQKMLRAVKFGKLHYYWRSIDSHWDLEEASKEADAL